MKDADLMSIIIRKTGIVLSVSVVILFAFGLFRDGDPTVIVPITLGVIAFFYLAIWQGEEDPPPLEKPRTEYCQACGEYSIHTNHRYGEFMATKNYCLNSTCGKCGATLSYID